MSGCDKSSHSSSKVHATVSGNLKAIGFDTICKKNSQLISNTCTVALAAEKYYYFIWLMGWRSSFIDMECTLQSYLNMVVLVEEVAVSQLTIFDKIKKICDVVQTGAEQDKNRGVLEHNDKSQNRAKETELDTEFSEYVNSKHNNREVLLRKYIVLPRSNLGTYYGTGIAFGDDGKRTQFEGYPKDTKSDLKFSNSEIEQNLDYYIVFIRYGFMGEASKEQLLNGVAHGAQVIFGKTGGSSSGSTKTGIDLAHALIVVMEYRHGIMSLRPALTLTIGWAYGAYPLLARNHVVIDALPKGLEYTWFSDGVVALVSTWTIQHQQLMSGIFMTFQIACWGSSSAIIFHALKFHLHPAVVLVRKRVVIQVLFEWKDHPPDDAIWEYIDELQPGFMDFWIGLHLYNANRRIKLSNGFDFEGIPGSNQLLGVLFATK
ncbi:hypothetical protein L1987_64000 [Smallanthus sonchifolius]|uniref:Uncharacterized protein n=1 Tax=Smallanthus sonchifolius TaxID=185202 RepID=A0ACB9CF77_9ASTR|nr:hypothetical protein L1987_64000 [Smallanthus sonchifolius]